MWQPDPDTLTAEDLFAPGVEQQTLTTAEKTAIRTSRAEQVEVEREKSKMGPSESNRKNSTDSETGTEAIPDLICDQCDTAVRLTEATVSGDLADPEEVICPDCTGAEDRFT